jgi:hypothetical protein
VMISYFLLYIGLTEKPKKYTFVLKMATAMLAETSDIS